MYPIHPNNAEVIYRALRNIVHTTNAHSHPIHDTVRNAIEEARQLLDALETEDDEEPMCAECYGTAGTGHALNCTQRYPTMRAAARGRRGRYSLPTLHHTHNLFGGAMPPSGEEETR